MRTCITIAREKPFSGKWFRIYAWGTLEQQRVSLYDRRCNQENFPRERVFRLPRRLGVERYKYPDTCPISSRRNLDGTKNRNVE